jgi:hypothetical protein
MLVYPTLVFADSPSFIGKVCNAPLEGEYEAAQIAGELHMVLGISGPLLNGASHFHSDQ